jgi:hypothetical protein
MKILNLSTASKKTFSPTAASKSIIMSEEMSKKLKFIENELPKLMTTQKTLNGHTILSCKAEAKIQLDGFMSSIFTVELVARDSNEK